MTPSTFGFLYQTSGTGSSRGVVLQHKPTSSLSGLGLVNNEMAMVARKQIVHEMVARQKLPAMTEEK
jgi:hypothetical protein